jgi:hypothetical protein
MGGTTSITGAAAGMRMLLKHSVESLDAAARPTPYPELYQPNGAVIFLVRRMG